MTSQEAVTMLDELLLNPAPAALEAHIRGAAAELIAQIHDHPLSYRGRMLPVEIDLDPLTGGRHRTRVWVPDVAESDAFTAQLVVERQLRDALAPIGERRSKGQHS
jgi:hypothetical protein